MAILTLFLLGCPEAPTEVEVDASRADVGFDGLDTDRAVCPRPIALGAAGTDLSGDGPCVVEITLDEARLTEITGSDDVEIAVDGSATDEPNWRAPHALEAGEHTIDVTASGAWSLRVDSLGPPVSEIARERSLVWVDPAIVDDPTLVGLGRLMDIAASPGSGREFFAAWLRRFATTAHSERVGPLQMLEEIETTLGPDVGSWNLDDLDFRVTAVHNRIDLARDGHCGELRVSMASTDDIFQPFHAIFLFRQIASSGDVSPAGWVHCAATARRWAQLSDLDDDGFHAAAAGLLSESLVPSAFLMVETVEFIVSPWEWRQWLPTANANDPLLPRVLENPPLFQTVDTARLNTSGALRDDFLRFVSDNAAALDARQMLLPDRFRAQSARVNAGVPWIPLDLAGVEQTAFPDLRRNIEIVGCPACHAADAEFIQTRPDRTFSPFYDKELDARAVYLSNAHRAEAGPVPFGPLQLDPVLPP